MAMNITSKAVVLGLKVTRIDIPKGYSLTIQYAPADPPAKNAEEVSVATFLLPVIFAKMLREELNKAVGE
jgi:hypothetical protein